MYASDLTSSFTTIHNNALALISPLTGNVNHNGTQALSFRLENLSSTAAAATIGRLYYQTTAEAMQLDDGGIIRTVWEGAQAVYHAEGFGGWRRLLSRN